ncbi:head-tail connector protein [Sphingobium mellinum]|uniref:head-tail connector protein n=1 Tax=Sphingobium mellinum TaxID=1387166 RepID=UPI0030EB88DA
MLFTLTPMAMPEGYGEALLSLDAAKLHLRVDDDAEDDLIEVLRDAALQLVEKVCGIRLGVVEGIVATFPGFGRGMQLGVGPVPTVEVTAVSYSAVDGETVDLPDGGWRVAVDGALVAAPGTIWPEGGPVTVTFTAGYAADACPAPLIAAAKLALGYLYAMRDVAMEGEASGGMPAAFGLLCNAYRMPTV